MPSEQQIRTPTSQSIPILGTSGCKQLCDVRAWSAHKSPPSPIWGCAGPPRPDLAEQVRRLAGLQRAVEAQLRAGSEPEALLEQARGEIEDLKVELMGTTQLKEAREWPDFLARQVTAVEGGPECETDLRQDLHTSASTKVREARKTRHLR